MKKKKDECEDKEEASSQKTETSSKQESKAFKFKNSYFLLAFIFILVAVVVGFIVQKKHSIALRNIEAVSYEVYTKFNEFDQDDDGYLSPKEFEFAYFHLTKLEALNGLEIKDVELQNVRFFNINCYYIYI